MKPWSQQSLGIHEPNELHESQTGHSTYDKKILFFKLYFILTNLPTRAIEEISEDLNRVIEYYSDDNQTSEKQLPEREKIFETTVSSSSIRPSLVLDSF